MLGFLPVEMTRDDLTSGDLVVRFKPPGFTQLHPLPPLPFQKQIGAAQDVLWTSSCYARENLSFPDERARFRRDLQLRLRTDVSAF